MLRDWTQNGLQKRANRGKLACMPGAIGTRQLRRSLSGWQEQGHGPAYQRLAEVLAAQLVDGQLPVRTRLPSERDLATELGLSRTTVTSAYERLREEGYLISRQGSGSWTTLPANRSTEMAPLTPGLASEDFFDLAVAAPGAPPGILEAATTAAAHRLPTELLDVRRVGGHGYHPEGLPELRARIAERFTARGAVTSPEQILITSGAQGAIHLLASRLLSPGDVVVVEQPTYPNALEAFRRTGARLVPLPVTPDGWDLDQLADTLESVRPRFVYLQPDFHNPTGALMDDAGRERLVAAARRAGTLLLIDETHVELALNGQAMPAPVAALERDGRVVTIGSLSKVVWGGLRIGWIRTSPRLIADLATERSGVDLSGPVLGHLIAVEVCDRLAEALAARREQLAASRDLMSGAIVRHLPEWSFTLPEGGLSIWAKLDGPRSSELEAAAGRHRLRLAAGPRFSVDGTLERFLRLQYTLPPDQLETAVIRLAAADAGLVSARRPQSYAPLIA
jgi:DNA-binding transcriptional MocR family regulator